MDDVMVGREVRLGYWSGNLDGSYRDDPVRPVDDAYQPSRIDKEPVGPGDDWAELQNDLNDHAVIATHRPSGRSLGMLTATTQIAEREIFMRLTSVRTGSHPHGRLLLRRMVALLLLRLAGLDGLPRAFMLDAWDRDLIDILSGLAAKCDGSRLFPNPAAAVIPLQTAALAQRMGRVLGRRTGSMLVLDLRDAEEAGVIEYARKLHRARLPRIRRTDTVRAMPSGLQPCGQARWS